MPLHPKVLLQGDTPSAYSNFQFKVWDQVLKDYHSRGVVGCVVEDIQHYVPQYHAAHIYAFNSSESKFGLFSQCSFARENQMNSDLERDIGHAIFTTQCDEPKIPANFNAYLESFGDGHFLSFDSSSNHEFLPKLYTVFYRARNNPGVDDQCMWDGFVYKVNQFAPTYRGLCSEYVQHLDSDFYSPLADNMFSNLPLMVDYENNGYSLGVWQEEAAGLPPSLIWSFK